MTAETAATATADRLPDVLDAATLARLAELDPSGSGLVGRVLRTYVASLVRLREQFARGRAEGDHDALRHVAHTLKSSSASVGALELSRLCGKLEQHVRTGRLDGVPEAAEQMLTELDRVRAALAAQVAG